MITHLSKDEITFIRRQLLTDIVYVITHDAIKTMCSEHTKLSPVDIYLSAQNFAKTISQLSDVDEGLEDEMDDLYHEAANDTEAMFILVLTAIMLEAVDKKNPTQQTHDTIIKIFQRCQDNPMYMNLLEQFAHKEEKRFAAGKITDLMTYELADIKRNEEGAEAIRTIISGILANVDKTDPETIKSTIILLAKFNIDNNHVIEKELNDLYDKLGYKTTTIQQIQELVLSKHVDNEVNGVAPGAVGIENKK